MHANIDGTLGQGHAYVTWVLEGFALVVWFSSIL